MLIAGQNQASAVGQGLAVAFAHAVMVKGIILGCALRQPCEKKIRGKCGMDDDGTGWPLPISSTWRTRLSSYLIVDVQSIAAGNDKFSIYQDALDSFSHSLGSSLPMVSKYMC